MQRMITGSIMAAVLTLPACADEAEKPQQDIEGALSHVFEGQAKLKAQDEGMAKLKEKADAEAQQSREEAYAKAVALPAQLPASLDEACAQMSTAYDAFMQSKLQATALERWNATKAPDLEKGIEHCRTTSIEVAACQANALTNPPPTATDESGRDLLLRCEGKFGEGAEKVAAK